MSEEKKTLNFIEQIVEKDLLENKHGGRILTRFPPEPNGYLHIGHAKSIVLNFGLAQKYGGKTNLRFDDTNPTTEDVEYVDSILEDVRWLGYSWNGDAVYASDYFEQLYEFALALIKKGLAYVDDSSAEEIAAMKGTPTEPGIESPFRNRSVEENLDLFERMRTGEFGDGQKVLRAKVDMAAPNMHLRDPLMYRIKKARHHRTGDKWNIYPMYDFAHGQSDSIEQITHSICTLEFEVHRPLYEWFIQKLEIFPSRQIEFARLNLSYTIMSKRRLLKLVEGKYVSGWDDPRMPTISGLRRRGYTPESIRNFADRIGIARRENVIDVSLLEFSVREHLNKIAKRVMVVMDPIKMVITNYPAGQNELLDSVNNPEDDQSGSRQLIFSNTLYIERDDFMVEPQKGFYRLGPGLSVRLKDAYKVTCENFVLDEATGKVKEIHCLYHPDSKSGQDTSSVNVKATIHWVDVNSAVNMEI
ncbi:MAG TPA: glutamine--tRNA ligase, partial [Saprospirales bacterium]|nr:glutamine--tRNA ligase [Saprospirales bacterium]